MAKRKKLNWVRDEYNPRKDGRKGGKEKTEVSEEDLKAYDQHLKEEFWFPPWGKYLAW